ncbi:MAG: hypothetical protein IJM83_10595 [Firmicutes bacterium]|nr:hypothetical protein [Bacillota bacterium]
MEIYNSSLYVKSADEDQREADAWLQKVAQLEKQYQDELTAAGDDPEKKSAVIKLIAEEAGMPPRLAIGMMNRPIVSQINHYFRYEKVNEPTLIPTPANSWTCTICKTENTGIFCTVCGAKRP